MAALLHTSRLIVGDGRSKRFICNPTDRLFFSICKWRKAHDSRQKSLVHAIKAATTPLLANVSTLSGRYLRMPSSRELARMKLPALECSFPSETHPDYERVRPHCDEWIEKVAQPSIPAARRFLYDCLLPRLVCRFVPRALPGDRLLHAIKLIAWLMIADDDDDHPDLLGSDYASTSHHADRVMAILTCAPKKRRSISLSTRYSNRLDALAALWEEMCVEMSPLLRSRFTSSMADYLEGLKMQAALRKDACMPNVESYMEIRRYASFTIPAFIVAEYASGIELDQETLKNAHVVELMNKAVDYVSLCNDIFSCYKEITLGDYFNLPSILYAWNDHCTTFQDAMDDVAESTKKLNACCNSLIASIREEYSNPSIDQVMKQHTHAYTEIISLGMSGALAWFYESPRYPQP